jgi:hypothetical protein
MLVLQTTEEELQKTIQEHAKTICAETLATMSDQDASKFTTSVKIDGMDLTISLQKRA